MAAQVTSSISTIFNGYTNPPITNPEGPRGLHPRPPCDCREVLLFRYRPHRERRARKPFPGSGKTPEERRIRPDGMRRVGCS